MTDEINQRHSIGVDAGSREPQTNGDAGRLSATQVGLLVLMIFLNLLTVGAMWVTVSAH